MSRHAPKQLALEALREGRLSPAGRARLQRHLEACEVCRGALDRMARYHATATELRAEPLPEIDWERIEASLPDAVARRATSRRRPRWLWPAVSVAAAFAISWLSGEPTVPTPTEAPGPTPRLAEPGKPVARPPVAAEVTLAANTVRAGSRSENDAAELHPRAPLGEGTWLHTGPEGSLHVRLGPGTGLRLGPSTSLELAELREGRTRLRLERGSVASVVAKLGRDDRFDVEAGEYGVHVRGTRFRVEQSETHTGVAVDEGRVEVTRGGTRVGLLAAGARWSSGGSPGPVEAPAAFDVLGLAHALGGEAWLQVEASPVVRAWLPAGEASPIRASGSLRMRLPPGQGSLQVLDGRGRPRTLSFELAPEGSELTEQALRRQLAPEPTRSGNLEVAQIMPVLKRGMGGLRSCYERALRGGHSGGAELVLNLRVSPSGAVDQVRVEGEGLTAGLSSCVQARSRRWRFPPPEGGPAHLRLPVNLRPRQR